MGAGIAQWWDWRGLRMDGILWLCDYFLLLLRHTQPYLPVQRNATPHSMPSALLPLVAHRYTYVGQ